MLLYIKAINALARMQDKERGATMPEYGLMVALIAIACIVGVTAIGANLQTLFADVATRLVPN